MQLSTPIENLPRVGPQYQKKLEKLGVKTVLDLLFHFPHRYEDFSNVIPISEAKPKEQVCVLGKILKIENTHTWKRRMTLTKAAVKDDSGSLNVIWFNQPYLVDTLKEGDAVCLAGKITDGKNGLYLSSPFYEKINDSELNINSSELTHTGRLVPIYPETRGLSSKWLRSIIKPALFRVKDQVTDFLPEKIKNENGLMDTPQAIFQIHFPDSMELAKKAREKFSFEELFLIQLQVLKERMKLKLEKAVPIPINLDLIKNFLESLPFTLTGAQKKASWQILKDLEKPRPMNRLLEGDVGSGKTIVAVMACLNCAKAGYQTAIMAPTEVLAKQHFKNFSNLLKDFGLRVGILTGEGCRISEEKISRGKFLEKLGSGKIDILIGTHALIQDKVKFGRLALVVLDEQHRFGVEQRAKLCRNSGGKPDLIPHLLSMTATPIPRTLALSVYGDLDLSLLDEMPKGRKKIITKVIPPSSRNKAYGFIKEEVKNGRQVFVICPRIEPGEVKNLFLAEVKAVKEEYEKLSKTIFPDLKVEMLHGKMKPKEKEGIMEKFASGKIDILVSTSVIEVGIDVPNATIMMIEGADRFGLSQLHQFRGRVGRGENQSFCFLFAESSARKTSQRLKALITCENGFDLAEKDLDIRGPGEIFGSRQWGIPDLAMSSLKNVFLVEKVRESAKALLEEDRGLKNYPLLRDRLIEFGRKIHLE